MSSTTSDDGSRHILFTPKRPKTTPQVAPTLIPRLADIVVPIPAPKKAKVAAPAPAPAPLIPLRCKLPPGMTTQPQLNVLVDQNVLEDATLYLLDHFHRR